MSDVTELLNDYMDHNWGDVVRRVGVCADPNSFRNGFRIGFDKACEIKDAEIVQLKKNIRQILNKCERSLKNGEF